MPEILATIAIVAALIGVGYVVGYALSAREERKLQRLRDNKRRETIARRQYAARKENGPQF